MVNFYTENHTRRLKRKMFDISSYELDSSKKHFSQVKNGGKHGNQEVDSDYAWFLDNLTIINEQTKVIGYENETENKNENESENESENKVEKENEDETENDKDPQYCMFLGKLSENGKSYMLVVSQNDATRFLKYEEDEESDGFDDRQTYIDNIGDEVTSFEDMDDIEINQRANSMLHGELSPTKEVSRRKKISKHNMTVPHQGVTTDSCYQLLPNDTIPSDYGAFKYENNFVKYEDKVTSSDSDIQILDNDQDFCEVTNKVSSLKEKLIRILEKPYTQKEYEEQIELVKKKKPVCRMLDLRGRSISSALNGVTKSLLDDSPECFRIQFCAAKEPSKALNLLRMFRFWLEHVPNEDVFEPWLDKKILEVVPNKAGVDVQNQPAFE